MDYRIDLMEGLKDPEKAKEVVSKVQSAIDELVLANKDLLKSAEKANEVAAEYEKQLKVLTRTNIDLTEALKSIHIVLGSKDEKKINELMNSLAVFVMSSGAIKSGVISESSNK